MFLYTISPEDFKCNYIRDLIDNSECMVSYVEEDFLYYLTFTSEIALSKFEGKFYNRRNTINFLESLLIM